jgi:carbonic anhydrase/acetyltransferase-like protein (isoleucine patch superfamily)
MFVAPGADIIGDVVTGDDCGLWFRSVVRGDVNHIRIGHRTNIQDGAVLHVTTRKFPLHIGSGVTIGHGAVVHGCTVEDNCLIGIGAIILDGARIGEGCIIGAGSVVTEGSEIPSGHLALGLPAKPLRELTEAEKERILANSRHYVAEKDKYLAEMGSTENKIQDAE